MKDPILGMLNSKKFLAALLVGILGYVAPRLSVDPMVVEKLQYALMIYIGGQAVADAGKEKAKAEAQKKVVQ